MQRHSRRCAISSPSAIGGSAISRPPRYSVTPDRFAGYRQALEEAGSRSIQALIGEGDFNFGRGMDAADTLMRAGRSADRALLRQ